MGASDTRAAANRRPRAVAPATVGDAGVDGSGSIDLPPSVTLAPTDMADVVFPALDELELGPGEVELDLADELRPVRFTRRYTTHAEGSVLCEFGSTRVLCTATWVDGVPPFMTHSSSVSV